MENLRVELTNADLVEIDEFIVKEFNNGYESVEQCMLNNIDKHTLLEAAENWIRVDVNDDEIVSGGTCCFYRIPLSESFKNRMFEVLFRVIDDKGRKVQHFRTFFANEDGTIVVILPFKSVGTIDKPNLIDIWYRLLIPPTGQYSTMA